MKQEVTVSRSGDREVRVQVAGNWLMRDGVPVAADMLPSLVDGSVSRVRFDGGAVERWDSALVAFVHDLGEGLGRHGIATDFGGLPEGVQRLLALAAVGAEASLSPPAAAAPSLPARVGDRALTRARGARADLALLGEMTLSSARFVTGRAQVRAVDVIAEMLEAGVKALPIVSLTSVLLGAIIAFVGAVALRPFGAGLYVADVVSVAMLRELGALMTAILMAGRTGSSYAAQLATMKLTQELDALETMAIPSLDFLVLPRMLALSVMQPLLCVYANFVGIAGGAIVATAILDLAPIQVLNRTRTAVTTTTFAIGVGKSVVFGVLVAFLGCRAGLRAGRSAADVGRAATRAMVSAIVAIIVTDGAFAILLQELGV